VLLALGVASVVQAMPHALRLYGPACFASLAIWAILLRTAWRELPDAVSGASDLVNQPNH